MARKSPHIGPSFESWLDEEGIREEVTAAAIKAVIAAPARQRNEKEENHQAAHGRTDEDQPGDTAVGRVSRKRNPPQVVREIADYVSLIRSTRFSNKISNKKSASILRRPSFDPPQSEMILLPLF